MTFVQPLYADSVLVCQTAIPGGFLPRIRDSYGLILQNLICSARKLFFQNCSVFFRFCQTKVDAAGAFFTQGLGGNLFQHTPPRLRKPYIVAICSSSDKMWLDRRMVIRFS